MEGSELTLWKYMRIPVARLGDIVHFYHGNGYCGTVAERVLLQNGRYNYLIQVTGYGRLSPHIGPTPAVGTHITVPESHIYEVYINVEIS